MRRTVAALVVVLALGLAGCGDEDSALDHSEPAQIRVDIEQQNDSGETGTAALFLLPERQTQVTLELNGMPRDSLQPAEIRTGTCDDLDAEAAHTLRPVRPNPNGFGRSVTRLPVGLEELQSGGFAIVVRRSAASEVLAACGGIPTP